MNNSSLTKWRLEGFDTFACEYYRLPGEYETQEEAGAAARARLAELAVTQAGSPELRDRVNILPPGVPGGPY
ncbi:MAG: hypothetical protein ABMA26_22810 [Limisphaerales bacterium]